MSVSGAFRPNCCGQSASALQQFSDVDLLGNRERVVDLDAEVPHCALDLGVTKEQLNAAQVAGPSVDQRCVGSPQGVRAEQQWVESDAGDPLPVFSNSARRAVACAQCSKCPDAHWQPFTRPFFIDGKYSGHQRAQ